MRRPASKKTTVQRTRAISQPDVEAAHHAGTIIRKMRKSLGISQAALGALTGKHARTIGQWEQAQNVRTSTLFLMAQVCGYRLVLQPTVKAVSVLYERDLENTPYAQVQSTRQKAAAKAEENRLRAERQEQDRLREAAERRQGLVKSSSLQQFNSSTAVNTTTERERFPWE